jgi:ABC-type polar amino acid transport system ATPase subunit
LKEENKKTTFKLDVEDDFICKNIEYYVEGKITPVDSKISYNNKRNIKMVNNFVAHLFSQIEVKKHGTIIDEIGFAGIASTVKVCVSYPGAD